MAKWNADKDIKIFQKTPVVDIDDEGFVTVYSSPPLRSVKITTFRAIVVLLSNQCK